MLNNYHTTLGKLFTPKCLC